MGMVVAEPDATLLTACLNGYGKRTDFGQQPSLEGRTRGEVPADDAEREGRQARRAGERGRQPPVMEPEEGGDESGEEGCVPTGALVPR